MNAPGTKSAWKLLIAVSIVCGVAVFAAGFLHRQAVVDAVVKQQVRSAAVTKAMTKDVAGVNLTKQAKGADEKSLERSVNPPAGTDLVIFSLDGERVYATAGARSVTGDTAQVLDAAKGNVTRVVAGNDLVVYSAIPSEKKGNVAVAAVVTDYQKLLEDASGPLDGARMPLTALGMLLFVAGLVMFVRERKGGAPKGAVAPNTAKAEKVSKMPTFGKAKAAKVAKEPKASKGEKAPAKGRVSGFDPVPVTTGPAAVAPQPSGPAAVVPVPSAPAIDPVLAQEAPEVDVAAPEATKSAAKRFTLGRRTKTDVSDEAPSAEPGKKRALFGRKSEASEPQSPDTTIAAPTAGSSNDELQREVAIRQALEDQLESLRTRLQTQEEQSASAIRDLREQLETVQAGAAASTVGPAEQDMIQRLATMEAELTQARQAAAEATAQAASIQQELAAAASTTVAADAAEMEAQLRALAQQLEDAQRSASESEQRAQSIESVRGELEVRVAQLGSKAGELEQKAEQLEARLREANEGGDAVRAEIARLTSALAAAEARATELESAASARTDAEAEIARLRGELGKQMERAQVAEERIATLEADVLAAEAGVEELADVAEPEELTAVDEPEELTAVAEPEPQPTVPAVAEQERAAIASPFARLAEHDERSSASEVHDPDPLVGQESAEESVEVETESEQESVEVETQPEQASGEFASAIAAVPQPPSADARSIVVTSHIEVATEPEPEVPDAPHAEAAEEPEPEVVDAQVDAATEPEADVIVTSVSEPQSEVAAVEPEPARQIDAAVEAEPEPERQIDAAVEPEPEPARQIDAAVEPEAVVEVLAASADTEEGSDVEPVTIEDEVVATETEPEPEVQAATEPGPVQEWRQEWRPSEPQGEPQQQQAAIPPAPSDADRYDDVWAAAFPVEQQNGSHGSSASDEHIPTAEAEPQTEPDLASEPQAQDEHPAVASSLDDGPSEPEDGISVEDDLWALRARLAHAGDTDQPRQTPPAPSMS